MHELAHDAVLERSSTATTARRAAHASPAEAALPWLIRLRWGAVCGQVAAVLFARWGLAVSFPFPAVLAVTVVTAATNVAILPWRGRNSYLLRGALPGLLVVDTLALTVILFLTGGPANPFSAFYIVHVIMAVLVLGPAWAWAMAALSTACYASLFLAPGHHAHHDHGAAGMQGHYLGMWAAMTLVMVLTAYFAERVLRALRRSESELVQARAAAARHAHLASLTTLAAGAAHELSTPLGTIAVAVRELEADRSDRLNEREREDLRLIRSEVDRCRFILDRMHVSTLDDIAIVEVPMLIEQLERLLGERELARLDVHVDPAVTRLRVPLRAVSQAVAALVHNALDASPPEERVALRIEPRADTVRITVADRGAGIDPALTDKVEEPFFTTKPPGQGMGLGLFLVRLTAEQLGGRLELESRAGEGTTATIVVPSGGGDQT